MSPALLTPTVGGEAPVSTAQEKNPWAVPRETKEEKEERFSTALRQKALTAQPKDVKYNADGLAPYRYRSKIQGLAPYNGNRAEQIHWAAQEIAHVINYQKYTEVSQSHTGKALNWVEALGENFLDAHKSFQLSRMDTSGWPLWQDIPDPWGRGEETIPEDRRQELADKKGSSKDPAHWSWHASVELKALDNILRKHTGEAAQTEGCWSYFERHQRQDNLLVAVQMADDEASGEWLKRHWFKINGGQGFRNINLATDMLSPEGTQYFHTTCWSYAHNKPRLRIGRVITVAQLFYVLGKTFTMRELYYYYNSCNLLLHKKPQTVNGDRKELTQHTYKQWGHYGTRRGLF